MLFTGPLQDDKPSRGNSHPNGRRQPQVLAGYGLQSSLHDRFCQIHPSSKENSAGLGLVFLGLLFIAQKRAERWESLIRRQLVSVRDNNWR